MRIRRSLTLLLFLGPALLTPAAAFAQAFNVAMGSGATAPPSSDFGAAAGQGGVWDEVSGTFATLDDITGAATGVDFEFQSIPSPVVLTASPPGDDLDRLVRECLAKPETGVEGGWFLRLTDLEPGEYRLYLYTFRGFYNPGEPKAVTTGATHVFNVPVGSLTRTFGAAELVEGVDFVSADVRVPDDGVLLVESDGSTLASGLAGFQLVPLSRTGINLDLGIAFGTPGDTFGAAADQPGVWNEAGVGFTALDDLDGDASGVTILVDSSTGSNFNASTDEEFLLADNAVTTGGVGWQVDVSGLAPGPYDVYLYAPSNNAASTGTMTVNGITVPSISGRSDSQLVEGESWTSVQVVLGDDSLTIVSAGDSGLGVTGLAGLQIVPRFRQSLNVDLGFADGIPDSGYSAAAAARGWNEVGSGVTVLDDGLGASSGVSVFIDTNINGSSGAPPSSDAGRLLKDRIAFPIGSSVSITFNGLASGGYRVFLYAPSSSLGFETGPLTVQGVPMASLVGDPDSVLIEGTNWASVDVVVDDGKLNIEGPPLSASVRIAGIQIVSLARAALNVDVGRNYGRPDDSYPGASGQAGYWNEVKTSVPLLDTGGQHTGAGVLTDGSGFFEEYFGVPTSGDQAMLVDYGGGFSGWILHFVGIVPGDYTVYLYAPSQGGVPTGNVTIDGIAVGNLPGLAGVGFVEGLNWIAVDVTVDDYDLVVSALGQFGGVAGLQIVPSVTAALNVDFGTAAGQPSDGFGGASGQSGVWNSIDTGSYGLVDTSGAPSGITADVYAEGGTGVANPSGSDEERLLADFLVGAPGPFWSVELAGLAPGDYLVYIYGAYPTGPGGMVVNDVSLPELPGDPDSNLVFGTSWTLTPVAVTDTLFLAGSGLFDYGISGLQVVPLPEPGSALSVAVGGVALVWLSRRRAGSGRSRGRVA